VAAPAPEVAPAPPPAAKPVADPVDNYERLVHEGKALIGRGKAAAGMRLLRQAIEVRSDGVEALCALATTLLDRGSLAEAGTFADRAARLGGQNAEAHLVRGAVAQDKHRTAEARASYRRYLELAPHGAYAAEVRAILDTLR
jgi:Flp pilus assembly protein TadD